MLRSAGRALVLGSILVAVSACGADELGRWSGSVKTVCGGAKTLPGIDVSVWQGTVSWPSVKAAGKVFAFARVSHGTKTVDTQFAKNWPGMKAAGIVRGLYQYFQPDQSGVDQAKLLVQKLNDAGGLSPGDLPPVIDLETAGGLGPSAILASVSAWVKHIESALQRRPIIYTGSYFWDDRQLGTGYASYKLWTAHYTTGCPLIPNAWSNWAFWQHSDKGSVSGIGGPVDLDVFNGTAADLTALIQASLIGPPKTDGAPPDRSPDGRRRELGAAGEGGGPEAGGPDGRPGDLPGPAGDGAGGSGDSGCGCRLAAGGRPHSVMLLLLPMVMLLGRRRARPRPGPPAPVRRR